MNEVWVVMTDWTSEGLDHESDVYVYSSYEKAKKTFDEIVKEDKELSYDEYYDVEDSGYEWEEEENYWRIWETDHYARNHSEAKIEKREVNFR